MKEDKLEQFVRKNTEGFDNLDAPQMVWEAIESQLSSPKVTQVKKLWPFAWKAAAAILIFTSAWMLNDYYDAKRNYNMYDTPSAMAESPELKDLSDAEAYYTSQITNKQTELSEYTKQHPEIIEDLKHEFMEMDKDKAELKKDLAESNADEKVIEAIILSYRVKLEILDQMLTEMRKSGSGNTSKPVETNL